MAGDIEEFLRRAAQRRAQRPSQRPAPQPDIEILDADIIDETPPPRAPVLRGESVAEHVSEHMQDHVFDEPLSHLGEDVDHSDDRMEAHLHEYFEHDLGQLGAKTSVAAESTLDDDSPKSPAAPPASPSDVLQMLRDPASIRQAIILREVLTRPEDRW
jgi:hypothetical protein